MWCMRKDDDTTPKQPHMTQTGRDQIFSVAKHIPQLLLQFCIANYEALLVKYNHMHYSKFTEFIQHLTEDKKEQF